MHIFLLIAIPSILIARCISDSEYTPSFSIIPLIIGSLTAAALCVIEKFFIFSTYIYRENILNSFIHNYTSYTLPAIIVALVIFLLAAKDSIRYKSALILPAMGSFFAIMTPYRVLTGVDISEPFTNICLPLLFIFTAILISSVIRYFFSLENIVAIIASIIIALALALIPSIMETAWYYNKSTNIQVLLGATISYCIAVSIIDIILRPHHKVSSKN